MLLAVLVKQKSAFTPKIISFTHEEVSTRGRITSLTVGDETRACTASLKPNQNPSQILVKKYG